MIWDLSSPGPLLSSLNHTSTWLHRGSFMKCFPIPEHIFIMVDGMFVVIKAPRRLYSVTINGYKELIPQLLTFFSAKCYKETIGF